MTNIHSIIGIFPSNEEADIVVSYVSGDTEKQLSVSDANGQRLGQITVSKIQLIRRSNGLIVSH